MAETLERLRELMINRLRLNVKAEDIKEETTLFGPDSLGLDSVDVLELIVGIKNEFGVEIADRETAEKIFISVGAIVKFIEDNK